MPRLDVTIAGEVNLDLILYGLDREIPLDREVLATDFVMTLGSSSAILAHNLAALGSRVGFSTQFGDDTLGQIARERLRLDSKSGAALDLSRCTQGPAGSKTGVTMLLTHGSTRRILTYPGVMFAMSIADLDLDYLASARHFHLSSLFLQKALQPDLPDLFRELKRRGLTLSLDTNDDPEGVWGGVLPELLPLIDLLLPNEDELRLIAGEATTEEALDTLAGIVPLIVVKCGSRGALMRQGERQTVVAPVTVQPVDTIGAGDSFNAGFLHAWLHGATPQEAAAAGNITGALSTQRAGGTEAFLDGELRDSFLRMHGFAGYSSSPIGTVSSAQTLHVNT